MSAAASILSAVVAKVEAAVPGVTVSRQPRPVAELASFPHALVALTDYTSEPLEHGQELRTYEVVCSLAWRRAEPPDPTVDGERETAALALEALADAIQADATLSGAAPGGARVAAAAIFSHPDTELVFAELVVAADREAA